MKWIVADSNYLGGKPRIAGTRISIEFLLETLACGMSIQEIVKEYPSLTEEAIKGALEELAHSDRIAAGTPIERTASTNWRSFVRHKSYLWRC